MKKTLLNIVARIAAVTTVVSMVASVSPASAAGATSIKDTMTRLQIGQTAVGHVLSMTLTGSNSGTLLATYDAGFSAFTFTSASCSGGTVANNGTATNVVNVTLTTCGAGNLSIIFTGTNPGIAGSKVGTISGTASVTGTFAVSIADSDQVSVTATVDPSLTFDLDTALTDTESATPYSVALGTITTTDTRVSGSTDSINSIWIDLATNASGGAVVTVANADGTNGLKSAAVPADNINSATAAMADGSENYGLCVINVTQTTGTLSKSAPYNDGTCAADSETNNVDALSTTATNIISTAAPLAGGRAQIGVNAAVSGVTPAHNDYADTLTFVATATF